MKREAPDNTLILASAGSGKTYQLTNRYLCLLALEVDPGRIIALTFTRKAAGEFFTALLEKLARCCREPEYAAKINAELNLPGFTSNDFLPLLRKFAGNLHRLALGTLDSYFLSIVRAFPFELGLGGELEILDEHLAQVEKEHVYEAILGGSQLDFEREQGFLDAFRQSTHGLEEIALTRALEKFIDDQHEIYLQAPDGQRWGNPAVIWPGGQPWLSTNGALEPLLQGLLDYNPSPPWTDGQRDRWRAFAEAARQYAPGAPPANPLLYILERALAVWQDIEDGSAVLNLQGGKRTLDAGACRLLRATVAYFGKAELYLHLVRTHGIWKVLHRYETAYSRLVRERGKLQFSDLERILSGSFAGSAAPRFSQSEADSARLRIDYRLDAVFDHWLLDEFQDTSPPQWHAIRDLIDEAVQDPSGRRSLFVVGDAKQAIYGWRGGDSRLFSEIAERYGASPASPFERLSLADSYRSQPPVLEAVNRVFGDNGLLEEVAPRAAVERWEWREHRSALPSTPAFACLLEPNPGDGQTNAGQVDCFRVALGVLERIRPVKRGLSCAVLVQKNSAGHAFVDYVRHNSDVPIICESDVAIGSDNPMNAGLLALLKLAAHPSDMFALEHVRMTPLGNLVPVEKLDSLVEQVSRPVLDLGFEPFLRKTIDRLQSSSPSPLDPFSSRRAAELLEAARLFDKSGNRSIDAFLEFAGAYQVRELPAPGTVQVLTIHKSKGLGFDVVLLPDLEGNKLTQIRSRTAVMRGASRSVSWVCDLPAAMWVNADDNLRGYLAAREAEVAYEALCKLYVGMTRARFGLYLIAGRPGDSRNYRWLLSRTLCSGPTPEIGAAAVAGPDAAATLRYANGDPNWFQSIEAAALPASEEHAVPLFPPGSPRPPRLKRKTPSKDPASGPRVAPWFVAATLRAREFGTAVHAVFQQIEWLTPGEPWDPDKLPSALKASISSEAIAHVAHCLEQPDIRSIFERRGASEEVWRETAFEVILDGEWVSGTFDRVNLLRDDEGRVCSVIVIDFKSGANFVGEDPDQLAIRYGHQVDLYRRSAALLTGVPVKDVEVCLVFTAQPRRVDVASRQNGRKSSQARKRRSL